MRVKDLKNKSANRVDVSYLRQFNIQAFGGDNLYPQTLRNIIAASSTGSECAERFANFIEGNGFREVSFSETVVNRRGDTADDIHEGNDGVGSGLDADTIDGAHNGNLAARYIKADNYTNDLNNPLWMGDQWGITLNYYDNGALNKPVEANNANMLINLDFSYHAS